MGAGYMPSRPTDVTTAYFYVGTLFDIGTTGADTRYPIRIDVVYYMNTFVQRRFTFQLKLGSGQKAKLAYNNADENEETSV